MCGSSIDNIPPGINTFIQISFTRPPRTNVFAIREQTTIPAAVTESTNILSIEVTKDNEKPLWKWEEYFRKFGSRILTVDISRSECPDIFMVFVSKYCENIIELNGAIHDWRTVNELGPLIERLHKLRIDHAEGLDVLFHSNSNLETIDITADFGSLLPVHLPKLKDFRLRSINWERKSSETINFFKLNPQIEKLTLDTAPNFNIGNILEHSLNVHTLKIVAYSLVCYNFRMFGMFRRLRTLTLKWMDRNVMEKILQPIIDNGIPLTHLTLSNYADYPIESIFNIESIEYLKFIGIIDADLGRIGENVTNLKGIKVHFGDITFEGIHNFLTKAEHLTSASFKLDWRNDFDEVIIDANVFEDIDQLRIDRNIAINIVLIIQKKDVEHISVSVAASTFLIIRAPDEYFMFHFFDLHRDSVKFLIVTVTG